MAGWREGEWARPVRCECGRWRLSLRKPASIPFWCAVATVMVTGIWGAEVAAIITVGAEAAGITMVGRVADIADGIESGKDSVGGKPRLPRRVIAGRLKEENPDDQISGNSWHFRSICGRAGAGAPLPHSRPDDPRQRPPQGGHAPPPH